MEVKPLKGKNTTNYLCKDILTTSCKKKGAGQGGANVGGEIYLYGNSSLERSVPIVFRDQGDKLVLEEGDTFSAGIHCSAGVPGK